MKIGPLQPGDRPRWTELWRRYLEFYQTELSDAVYANTWTRLLEGRELHGLAARTGGEIVGITHFLTHASCWTLTPVFYLQDLFTDAARRNQGVARALIAAVADRARESGSTRMYWMTQSHNEDARALYDKVGQHTGFIRYEYPL